MFCEDFAQLWFCVVRLPSMVNMNSPNFLLLSWSKRMHRIFGSSQRFNYCYNLSPQLQDKFVLAKARGDIGLLYEMELFRSIISIRESIASAALQIQVLRERFQYIHTNEASRKTSMNLIQSSHRFCFQYRR
jgi:hypothetical protein